MKYSIKFIFLSDLIATFSAFIFAYLIRFDFVFEKFKFELWSISHLPILFFVCIKTIVFLLFKIQLNNVKHTSLHDLKSLLLANAASSISFLTINQLKAFIIDGSYLIPHSIIVMEFFISYCGLLGLRIIIIMISRTESKNVLKEKVLIYGAGISGLITMRTLEKDIDGKYNIVGFIDDNKKLSNTRMQGVKIIHSSNLLNLIITKNIRKIIFAIQHPNLDNQQKIIDLCIKHDVHILKVPNPKNWIDGDFSQSQLKSIRIEDLLGRKEIELTDENIRKEFCNKSILITGAAGSIGSGIVRQLAQLNIKNAILLDQAESGLYDFEQELNYDYDTLKFNIVVGDVTNEIRMERLFEHFRPDIVFHAAAYKHVPLMEDNPSEAIYTNIKGTKIISDLAVRFSVEKFIMISTDKAVNPTNVMGASKRIAEIYIEKLTKTKTRFITTRFGNVLGSNGSVIPLFKKQIEQGGPLTITDKNVTRYFMTIPEACQLVIEAGSMGKGGEIFVFDMGKPMKIIDLAEKMIKLSGLRIDKDIKIKVTGLRPGEKMYEELLSNEENTIPTHHPKILIAKMRDTLPDVLLKINTLIDLYDKQDNDSIVKLMKDIVPEFLSNNSIYNKLDFS